MTNWKLQYDNTINQYYYLNPKDNSILFDLPEEVKTKRGLFRKFSFKRKRSNDSSTSLKSMNSTSSSTLKSTENTKSEIIDDEYLLNNPTNFRNFAGTSYTYEDDEESIDSHSIVTFYSELDNDSYEHTFDKERERIELRRQFLKELQI